MMITGLLDTTLQKITVGGDLEPLELKMTKIALAVLFAIFWLIFLSHLWYYAPTQIKN